ncbi:MAG: response regulator [Deltaproteobacteria bacterium]|nr:response regulator [Deltaproteobacteria bacterium]
METTEQLLVIDDDMHVRTSICMYLEDLGYRVLQATNGLEGLQMFAEHNPAMVFCDLRMPGIDGLEVLQKITTSSPNTPIAVISGAGRIQDVVEALRRGAWNYVTKPIEDMAVLKHVATLALEKARLQRENQRYHAYLEDEVILRTRQLAKSTARAKILAEEANAANRAKGEFLANMSHELRTPLNSIMVLARVLAENREKNLQNRQIDMLDQISSSGHELLGLINEVLEVAEQETTEIQIEMKQISLRRFVDRIERILSPLAWQKGLAYSIDVSDDAPDSFFSDDLKASRVVRNIISNAVKFTTEGAVTVHVGQPAADIFPEKHSDPKQEWIQVQVSDTGIGIEPELQQRIFSTFMQADSADTRRYQGIGVGLAVASRFIAALGGDIHLESTPKKGSVFRIVFPVHVGLGSKQVRLMSLPPEPMDAALAPTRPVPSLHLHGEKILIADTDMRIVFNLSATLESLGAEALIATSEQTFLQRLNEYSADPKNALAVVICGADQLTEPICRSLHSMGRTTPGIVIHAPAEKRSSIEANCTVPFYFVDTPPVYDKIVHALQHLL